MGEDSAAANGTQFASFAKLDYRWGGAPQGVLALDGNRLIFVEGVGGDVPLDTTLDECEISFPRRMFGFGFLIRKDGKKYGVSFQKRRRRTRSRDNPPRARPGRGPPRGGMRRCGVRIAPEERARRGRAARPLVERGRA